MGHIQDLRRGGGCSRQQRDIRLRSINRSGSTFISEQHRTRNEFTSWNRKGQGQSDGN
jgi:hypothetical protein